MNRNLGNYFAKVEQAAFYRAPSVPGIGLSPDGCWKAACSSTAIRTAIGSVPHIHPAVNQPIVSHAGNYGRDTSKRTNINQDAREITSDARAHPSR